MKWVRMRRMMSGGSVAQPRVVDLPLYSIRADCWANYRRILVNVAGDGELDSRASSALQVAQDHSIDYAINLIQKQHSHVAATQTNASRRVWTSAFYALTRHTG